MIAAAPVASGRARAAAVLANMKANLRETNGERTWGAYDDTTRLLLVGMCTERRPNDAALPWKSFTAKERDSMGAAVAFLGKEFSKPLR